MRANTRKPLPSQTLRAEAPPKKRGRRANVVTIDVEVVKLHRHGGGHPSYDEAIATEILDQLAEGKTMRAVCRETGMPSARTVARWVADDIHGFAARYDRARKMQGDAIFDEVIDITNEKFVDIVEVQAAKLKVDARKWFLAKLHPDRFGDKVEITSRTEKLSDEQIDAQLFNLLETADHASLLKQPGTRKLLAKPRR
jgi:hypothetical protein